AIGMDPVAQRYRSRGSALLVLGRFDEALADFDRAIEAQPSRGVNYAARANVFLYRGQPLDGLKDVERAEAADPESAGAASRAGPASAKPPKRRRPVMPAASIRGNGLGRR